MDLDARLAKKIYNEQFEKYFKNINKFKPIKKLRGLIYHLLGNINNKKILFAGCGSGEECKEAIEYGAMVTGVDISEKQIDLAQKNIPEGFFLVGDFEKTKFNNYSFDIIISILSIMYKKNFDHKRPLLTEAVFFISSNF